MSIEFLKKLIEPEKIKELYPLKKELINIKQNRDDEIRKIFENKSNKFICIIGPCSADREDSIIEYVNMLSELQKKVKEKLLIIPRIYTCKPRSLGIGYKGILHHTYPNYVDDIFQGIISVRKLHLKIISESGLTVADELLYPDNYSYLSDLLSYVTIGARSVENQEHKFIASGIDTPVGMKNPLSGDLNVLLNSIFAAQSEQRFIYREWEVKTSGNVYVHAILRGSVANNGTDIPNYHYESLKKFGEIYLKSKYYNPAIIVDTNHSNSGKNFIEQIRIAMDVLNSRKFSDIIKLLVKGIMIESYIENGNQDIKNMTYGKSITDPCLGWKETECLVLKLADNL